MQAAAPREKHISNGSQDNSNDNSNPVMQSHSTNTFFRPATLSAQESKWRDRYYFFQKHGYTLRPRYHPDWTASWVGTTLDPLYCEDSIQPIMPMLMDASNKDGQRVCIKRINRRTGETAIGRYLTSKQLLQDKANHCVPFLSSFEDPNLPDTSYIVMPLLRPFDDPEFGALGEVVDFVTQTLEGLVFMHKHRISHGDLTGVNIMMDALPIFPRGWHFVSPSFSPDGRDVLKPLARIDNPVRYYLIDFDCSIQFHPGQSPVIDGLGGRDNDVPELLERKPFDHFKLDVFTLGNVFFKDFKQKYLGLEFLTSLTDTMMIRDPQIRPTAQEALHQWYRIRDGLNISTARWRLRKLDESVGERVINTVAAARDNLMHLFHGDERRTWSNP